MYSYTIKSCGLQAMIVLLLSVFFYITKSHKRAVVAIDRCICCVIIDRVVNNVAGERLCRSVYTIILNHYLS